MAITVTKTYNYTIKRKHNQTTDWPATLTVTTTVLTTGKLRVNASLSITNNVPSSYTNAWSYTSFTPTLKLVWFDNNTYPASGNGLVLKTWTKNTQPAAQNISISSGNVDTIPISGTSITGWVQIQIPSRTQNSPYYFTAANYPSSAPSTSNQASVTNNFTLTINANGGTFNSSTGNTTYPVRYGTGDWNNMASIAEAATRAGYTFKGIYTAASGGTQIYTSGGIAVANTTYWDSSSRWKYNGDVTLYAQWTEYQLTLKYHVNGGSITTGTGTTRYRVGSDSIIEVSTNSGSTWADYSHSFGISTEYPNLIDVATFGATKTGYTITGTEAYGTTTSGGTLINQNYSSSSTTNPSTAYRLNGNANLTANKTMTIYMHWKPIVSSVTLNKNGGSGGTSSVSIAYDTPQGSYPSITLPTRTGYTFAGYYDAASGGTQYYNSSGGSVRAWNKVGDTTLYAHWTAISGNIYYNAGRAYDSIVGTAKNNTNCDGLVAVSGHNNFAAKGGTAVKSTYNITSGALDVWNTTSLFDPPAGYNHAPAATNWRIWNATKSKWIDTDGANGDALNFSDFSSSDLSWGDTIYLFANWQGKTYTVNYYHEGTKVGDSSFTFGTAGTLKTAATLNISESGWEFMGWANADNRVSVDYTNGQSFNPSTYSATINLYAILCRTVYWKSGVNGATSWETEGYDRQRRYYSGTTVKYWTKNIGAPTAISGWTTLGWRGDATATEQTTSPTGNYGGTATTIYAVYSRDATFYHGYNKAQNSTKVQYYNSSNAYNIAATPTASDCTNISGWTELGWRDDTTIGNKEIDFGAATTSSAGTFYAVYSRTGTITYAGNGNTGGSTSNTTSNTQYLSSTSTTLNPTKLSATLRANGFTKTGYHFNGWDLGAAGATYEWTVAYNASTAKTATAQWVANTYTVVYNANGGTGTMSDSTFTYNATGNLRANGFTAPSGYTFGGWADTVAHATAGTVYRAAGAAHGNMTATNGGTVTIYAIWKRNITFYHGSNKAANNVIVQYYNGSTNAGANITTPTAATCTNISGWTELGWRDDTTAGNKEYDFNASISPSATTYYAAYSRTITFYHGTYGSTNTTTFTQYYNSNNSSSSITTPTAATCTDVSGWTELGWRDDTTAGDKEYNFNTSITPSSVNYYAVYSRTITFYHGINKAANNTKTQYYNSGSGAGTITTPTAANCTDIGASGDRPAWTELGWRDDTTADVKEYDFNSSITPSVTTYYAVYSGNITFKSGINKATSNTVAGYYNSNNTWKAITSATPAAIAASGDRPAWTALGWRTDNSATTQTVAFNTSFTPTAFVYYAVYSGNIVFKSGYNKATNTNVSGYYNTQNIWSTITTATSANCADISGWSELGWRDDTTADAKEYSFNTSVTPTAWAYYAVYSRTGTMSYNANGGTGSVASHASGTQYLNSGNTTLNPTSLSVTLKANGFTYPGYTFTKWDLGNASTSYSWTPAYNADPNKTANAQWSMNQQLHMKINDTWHTGAAWIKVNNAWKKASAVWIKVNGTWKQITKL